MSLPVAHPLQGVLARPSPALAAVAEAACQASARAQPIRRARPTAAVARLGRRSPLLGAVTLKMLARAFTDAAGHRRQPSEHR